MPGSEAEAGIGGGGREKCKVGRGGNKLEEVANLTLSTVYTVEK